MNSQTVTVNLVPGLSAPAVVRVSQYDVGRPLVFKLLDGTNNATMSGAAADVVGTKPSGLGFSVTGTVVGNTVTLNTTLDMTQESGQIPTEIRFSKSGEDIGTANFVLAVEKTPHAEGTTDGTQESMQNLETRLQGQIDALDSRIDAIEGDQSIIDDIDALDARVTALEQGGSGLSQTEKNLILTLFDKAAYAESDASTAYDALETLWTVTTRTVTYNLSHVTSSNTANSVDGGSRYTTTLTATGNYALNSVTVTMGGVDITSTSYSSGTVTIPSVTGNVVITATAVLAAQSITATYTQSGTVYDTDSLDSLKADLVVTANYAGGTSETVPASDYTLSGTLAEGTSTITVEYAGLTDTFTVTVTHNILPLYNWDFTQSLTDTVAGVTATLTGCTRDSSGVSFTAISQAIQLTSSKISVADKTFILDIPTFSMESPSGPVRLFMIDSSDANTQTGAAGWMYRNASTGWTIYDGSAWGSGLNTATYTLNYFNNKRLKIYVDDNLYLHFAEASLGSDTFVSIDTSNIPFASDYSEGFFVIGSTGTYGDLRGITISGVKIYEGEV